VHEEGLKVTIMMHHHAITLHQRLPVMERCLSFLGVIDYHHVEIQKRDILLISGLHDTDAPVDIGRVSIFLIIGCGNGEVGASIESLMTDEHTLTEGLPGEMLRGRKTTGMEEMTIGIDNVRVAVKDGGDITEGRFFCVG
jgi:hypothetical protein